MTTATQTSGRAAARPRRTQAERSATTRRRIIDAVAAVIAEDGFAQASSHRIAKRAGVTWGAVQYHFGAKADILDAVIEDGIERFEQRTRELASNGQPLARRVSLLVDRCWEFYSSLHYRAMIEIVLNARRAEARERRASHRRFAEAVCRAWSKVFADVELSQARRLEAEHFACSALSGLAVQAMLEGGPVQVRTELEILKAAIGRLLRQPDA